MMAMQGRTETVTFIVTIEVKPGGEAEFLRALAPVLDAMRHETTFVNAVLHRSPDDPSRFMIYETWADLDDVRDVQLARQYRQAYHDLLPALLSEPRRVEIWTPMRGDFSFLHAAA